MNRFALFAMTLACTSGAMAQTMPSTSPATAPSSQEALTPAIPQLPAPAYTVNRWDEDYSYLRNPSAGTNFLDSIKYIPLNNAGDIYLTLGGQVRERYEHLDKENLFGAPTPDGGGGGYQLQRLLPYADLHVGPYFRAFVEGRFAFEEDRSTARPNDLDQADLEQAFIDLKLPLDAHDSLTTRIGRQDLSFGLQRLIGPADWNNARRTFDGFRETLSTPGNDLDIFLVKPVQVEKYMFNSDDWKTTFAGIYDTLSLPALIPQAHTKFEPYVLYLDRAQTKYAINKKLGDDKRFTIGGRFTTHPGDFDFDLEGDYQCGDFQSQNIAAFSFATVDGYTFSQVPLSPHPYVGFDIASGDSNKNNSTLGTYNQLFPTGHNFFGYMDVIGRQNIIDIHPGIDFTLIKNVAYAQNVNFRVEQHFFSRETVHDAAYNVAGGVLRNGTSTARQIGSELDMQLNWQINRNLSTYAGYSHFFAGDYLRDTGTARDIDFFYAAATFTF